MQVYDITGFIDKHPGGPVILRRVFGKDATRNFKDAHSWIDLGRPLKYVKPIGTLVQSPPIHEG
jgi:cytochrome b involved in lipid metabolism